MLLTTIAALFIVVIFRPYVVARAESSALKRLETDWSILLDEEAFLGRDKSVPPLPDHWLHWPAKRLFGEKKLYRIQKLRMVGPKTEPPSHQELAKCKYVTHLEFNRV